MKFLIAVLFLSVYVNVCLTFTSNSLKVRIDDGRIIGRHMTSISGKAIRAFMGVPYAAPPVGDLRFKAPKKPNPWHDKTLLAQKEPPMCIQGNIFERTGPLTFGQEDCLYLNVYTPDINSLKSPKKLPVMVWIHGGAWSMGHSGHTMYGPEYLLEHEIVLVTLNYRLGTLGFLSTEDEHCTGNFGFKDQLKALEWVQMNIEKFGGDASSVTIFGESAGAASVHYHMFSPMSRGLFHKAISQSGTLMESWAQPQRKGVAKMRAVKLAEMMNCPISGSSIKQMVECLRKAPADKITGAIHDFLEWHNDPIVAFGPVVEYSELEEEPFIADLKYKKFSLDIPWMNGITSEEGIFKTAEILNSKKLTKELVDKWETILPLTFSYDHLSQQDIIEMNVAIYDFYFSGGFLGEYSANVTNMWSDGFMIPGFVENLKRRLENNNRDNTFVYLFTHKGSMSFSEFMGGKREIFYGTSHGDDLFYLFPAYKNLPVYFDSAPTKEDIKLRKLVNKLWVNFATTGKPTPEWSKDSKMPYWSPASTFPLDYMQIGNENGNSDKLLEMKKDLFSKNAEFWMKLREKYGLNVWQMDDKSKDEL